MANVEKAINRVSGVQEAWFNFADHTEVVEGGVEHESVIYAIEDAGYGASDTTKSSGVSDGGTDDINHYSIKLSVPAQ